MKQRYYVADAFADHVFEGNPAGVCILDELRTLLPLTIDMSMYGASSRSAPSARAYRVMTSRLPQITGMSFCTQMIRSLYSMVPIHGLIRDWDTSTCPRKR